MGAWNAAGAWLDAVGDQAVRDRVQDVLDDLRHGQLRGGRQDDRAVGEQRDVAVAAEIADGPAQVLHVRSGRPAASRLLSRPEGRDNAFVDCKVVPPWRRRLTADGGCATYGSPAATRASFSRGE